MTAAQVVGFRSKLGRTFYNTLVRRNSLFLAGIFASAFAFELAFDNVMDRVWDRMNEGRQWKDIKHKYE